MILSCMTASRSGREERAERLGLAKWNHRARLVLSNIITKLIKQIFIYKQQRDQVNSLFKYRILMGNYCHDVQNEEKYQEKELKDEPSATYAIEIIDPKEIPCDLNHIRTLFRDQNISQPDWYQPYQCVKIDAFFLIKRYDLYYCGEWKKGVPYGLGEVVTSHGEYFKGYFQNGIAKGPKCIFVLSPHTYYIGSVDQNQRNGRGKFADQEYEYEGQWLSNLPHGTGNEVFPNGDKFYGEFVLGKKQGEGQYIWKQGQFQIYRGHFSNNQMSREGQLTCRDGRVWKGLFSCDKNFTIKEAQCVTEDTTFQGTLVNGKPIDTFTLMKSSPAKDEKYVLSLKDNKFSGRILSDKQSMVFQDRVLVYYDQNMSSQDMANILQIIQSSYKHAKKHTQALAKINQSLPNWECNFWKEGQDIQGIAIVPICGRFVRVSHKKY